MEMDDATIKLISYDSDWIRDMGGYTHQQKFTSREAG